MWRPTKKAKYGVAIYNFNGKVKWGLALQIGETVQISEECNKWYRGFSMRNKAAKGIFPASHIHLKDFQIDVEGPNETVTPVEDPVVKEVSFVLREWSIIWKRLYIEKKDQLFMKIRGIITDLIQCRKQLISGTLTKDQSKELKCRITSKIDWGNNQLNLDLVPRIDSEQVDVEKISPVELYRIHEESSATSKYKTARGSARSSKPVHSILTHHLYFLFKTMTCIAGDEMDIHFSLYDGRDNRAFSEKFVVKLSRNGLPMNTEQFHNCSAIFTDLGNKDLLRDAYLVAHIFRWGSLRDEQKKVPTTPYKRPYGCAVLKIKDILLGNCDIDEEGEVNMKVYCCNHENEFPQLHENIIRRQGPKFSGTPTTLGSGIVVSLRMLHGEIDKVRKQHPVLLRGAAIARKLGFPDVIMPGDVRNDLYVTLTRGEFERGGKTAPKNVEIRVMVINDRGTIMQDCIFSGAGVPEVKFYNPVIFYHCNTPKWNDTIKVTIPIERFEASHIRLELRHCSTRDKAEKKMFGFGFVKLHGEDGTTLPDGAHELFVYKCEDANKLKNADRYLNLPSTSWQIDPAFGSSQGNVLFNRSEREMIHIETLLCSTKLTQNADLLGLLKWRSQPDKLDENLHRLMNVDGQEIVKYLQDIMDSLMAMFTIENGRLPQAQLVFKALIHIFKMLGDQRYEHFKPVMDAYIANHFSAVLVYKDLLICLREMLDAVTTTSIQTHYIDCFTVLQYIAKCVVQSRLLYTRTVRTQNQEEFKALVQQVFDAMRAVLSVAFEMITKTQGVLLAKIPELMGELCKVTPALEIARNMCLLITSLPKETPVLLLPIKLQCIRDVLASSVLASQECKGVLLPMVMGQLKKHLINSVELKLCADILGDILLGFAADKQQSIETSQNIEVVLTKILEVVVSTTAQIMGKDNHPCLGHLVAGLVAMWKLMEEDHYRAVLNCYNEKIPLKEFLLNVLKLFRELVTRKIYGKDWAVMRMVTNHVVLLAVGHFVADTLNKHFLTRLDFDGQLWSYYFRFAVSFLTQPCLQLETFSEAKRQKIQDRYGDMRVRMGYEILGMWQNLGDHKLHFIPGMVGPFLEMTLVPETELRKATLPIFFDMMECEQRARGNFKQVESELIDKLDILVSENKGDDEYKQLFNMILLGKVKTEPSWQENGTAFVGSVTKLLERLLDYRNVLEGEENRDKRMTCTVNLLNFYKNEINREEMYIRYIYKLRDLHLQCGNHTEAGFTLLLHAELLKWSEDVLHGDVEHPREQEWSRKERLYRQILEYFDKGQTWEFGISLCKELAQLYESKIEYALLSQILQTQATFYNKILNEHRAEQEYFRVGFFGQRFPLFLRNKEFVYRGAGYERLSTFQQRMLSEFPGATIMGTGDPPSEQIKQGDSQCIQIQPVKPLPQINQAFLAENVPENVRSFYRVNLVDRFQLDRPFHKGEKDPANVFKTLWLDRTEIYVEHSLPGILRWFEVTHSRTTQLSPIQVAIDMVENKSKSLQSLISHYLSNPKKPVQSLTMELKGVLVPEVSGGLKNYESFLSETFPVKHAESAKYVPILRAVINQQVSILESALPLHKRLVSADFTKLHQVLVEGLEDMKKGIESLSPSMSRLRHASEILKSEKDGNRRLSSQSTKSFGSSKSIHSFHSTPTSFSSSPAYTPTPPNSNRSSCAEYDIIPDNTDSDGDISTGHMVEMASSTNTLVGYGCIYPLTGAAPGRCHTCYSCSGGSLSGYATWGGNSCSLQSLQCLSDALFNPSQGRKMEGGPENLVRNRDLKAAESCISIDSGVGLPSVLASHGAHKRTRTSSPHTSSRKNKNVESAPPRLPPRKPPTPGPDGDSCMTPTRSTGAVKPPLPHRTPLGKRESMPATLTPQPINEEPSRFNARVPPPANASRDLAGKHGYVAPPVPPKRSMSAPVKEHDPVSPPIGGQVPTPKPVPKPRANYTNVYIPPATAEGESPPPVPERGVTSPRQTIKPKLKPKAPEPNDS